MNRTLKNTLIGTGFAAASAVAVEAVSNSKGLERFMENTGLALGLIAVYNIGKAQGNAQGKKHGRLESYKLIDAMGANEAKSVPGSFMPGEEWDEARRLVERHELGPSIHPDEEMHPLYSYYSLAEQLGFRAEDLEKTGESVKPERAKFIRRDGIRLFVYNDILSALDFNYRTGQIPWQALGVLEMAEPPRTKQKKVSVVERMIQNMYYPAP